VTADRHVLVLGGQRSGKSRFAENLVAASGRRKLYVATAAARDSEMEARIALHRSRRGEGWTTIEEPLDLPAALAKAGEGDALLVDCLTLWLSNLMEAGKPIDSETDSLVAALERSTAAVVLVSNEVGLGIIPANALARRFADAQGTLNHRIAEAVGRVVLMAAGRPLLLKPSSAPEIVL